MQIDSVFMLPDSHEHLTARRSVCHCVCVRERTIKCEFENLLFLIENLYGQKYVDTGTSHTYVVLHVVLFFSWTVEFSETKLSRPNKHAPMTKTTLVCKMPC